MDIHTNTYEDMSAHSQHGRWQNEDGKKSLNGGWVGLGCFPVWKNRHRFGIHQIKTATAEIPCKVLDTQTAANTHAHTHTCGHTHTEHKVVIITFASRHSSITVLQRDFLLITY